MKEHYEFSEAKRGPVIESKGKTRITIMLDDDILQAFRERSAHEGKGYQTLINEALRNAVKGAPDFDLRQSLEQLIKDYTEEQKQRQKERQVFVSSISKAAKAFDKALLAAERTNLPKKDVEDIRRATSTVDLMKDLVEATNTGSKESPAHAW
jgi:predicted DNA binding CopG/RHH family protein